jgi:putative FmdB family regulatory protein
VPTYQYTCTACGEELEAVQKFTDDPLTVCDACGGQLRKVYSAVGIVFKGSGFYRTDSRNGSGRPGATDKQANGSGDSSSGKGDASTDSGSSSGGKSETGKSETGEAKPAKKTEKASSSGTGSKVA